MTHISVAQIFVLLHSSDRLRKFFYTTVCIQWYNCDVITSVMITPRCENDMFLGLSRVHLYNLLKNFVGCLF